MTYKKSKKYIKGVFAAALTILSVSCIDNGYEEFEAPTGNVNNIQPNTQFTTSTSADNPMTIIFRSYSTDAESYAWDFGDGTTSTEANPDYTYSEGGLYMAKLTTISSDNLEAIDSSYVSPISVDFTTSSVDTEVSFENLTDGAAQIDWDFGDGETLTWTYEDENGEENENFSPTHTYASDETFVATLTATNFLGVQTTLTKNIEGLILSTIPEFSYSASGLVVTFTDESVLAVSYSWDFGDGNSSTEQNPIHTYTTNGAYDVTLTTTNEAGVAKSITKSIPVGGVPATFAAVIQNGDMQTYPTSENNSNDLVDAWTIDPDNTFNNGDPTPFNFWRNDDLEGWVSTSANTGGSTDKMSSSGTDAKSAGGTSDRSLKFDSAGERAYQPFEVETGVEYTITAWARTDGDSGLTGTFYILSGEPASEEAGVLDGLALAKYELTSSGAGNWDQASFSFAADATFSFSQSSVDEDANDILTSVDQKFVIFYFVPNGASGTANAYLTDVVINTPSLSL